MTIAERTRDAEGLWADALMLDDDESRAAGVIGWPLVSRAIGLQALREATPLLAAAEAHYPGCVARLATHVEVVRKATVEFHKKLEAGTTD